MCTRRVGLCLTILVLLALVLACANPYQETIGALEQGDVDGAAAIIEKAYEKKPSDEEVRLGMARVRLAQDNAKDALVHLTFLQSTGVSEDWRTELFDLLGEAYAELGRNQAQAGSYSEAQKTLEKALEYKDRPDVRNNLGLSLLQLGEDQLALDNYKLAIAGDPTLKLSYWGAAAAYDNLERGEEVVPLFEAGRSHFTDDDMTVELALRYSRYDRHEDAVLLLDTHLAAQPACEGCYEILIDLHGRKKAYDLAEAAYALRVANLPTSVEHCLAHAAYLGDRRKSIEDRMAVLTGCIPIVSDAEPAYREALHLQGMDYRSSSSTRKANLDKAVAWLDGELAARPDRLFLTSLKAEVLMDAGEKEEAFALALQQAEARPSDPKPHLVLARLHELGKDEESTVAELEKAMSLAPTDMGVVEAAVSYRVRHKQYEEAKNTLNALADAGVDQEAWVNLAERARLQEDINSCLEIGTGQPTTGDVQAYTNLVNVWNGSWEPTSWTARGIQGGYVANHCRQTTVDVQVTVAFKVKRTSQLDLGWLSAFSRNTSYETKKSYITLRDIAPGEAKRFSGSVSTSSSDLFGLGASVESIQSINVWGYLLSPRFELRPK